jgi:uncharacterized phiE125 gp8 family phage protein
MIFELLREPMADGYGDALLPLAECKQQLSIDASDTEWDVLIPVLRDAAIGFVEDYCETRLAEVTGIEWQAEAFPAADTRALELGVYPVSAVTAIAWADSAGEAVTGDPADFRIVSRRQLLPAIGGDGWPSDVGGSITITLDAGYTDSDAPAPLLQAARLFLGHLFKHREAVITSGMAAEVPLGVTQLCSRYRRVTI